MAQNPNEFQLIDMKMRTMGQVIQKRIYATKFLSISYPPSPAPSPPQKKSSDHKF